uniref:Uncharacterized protein n=1 Tax=Desulfovibrio sp. U5L TaxID=596152 RepID=I2Q400_9BACT
MAVAGEVMRSVGETQSGAREALDALANGAGSAGKAASGFADFFHRPENLLALAVCVMAVAGLYSLLRSENIIPSARPRGGSLLGTFLARRLALRIIFFIVVAAFGLALATGRLAGLAEIFRNFF